MVQYRLLWRRRCWQCSHAEKSQGIIAIHLSLTVSYSGSLARKIPLIKMLRTYHGPQACSPRQNYMTNKTRIRSRFMLRFLAYDDTSCTRLKDLLDRNFFREYSSSSGAGGGGFIQMALNLTVIHPEAIVKS